MLYPSRSTRTAQYTSIEQLLVDVLQTFDLATLNDPNNWGTTFVKEGALQHMFWAGVLTCLPPSVRVTAEVSHLHDSEQKRIASSTGILTSTLCFSPLFWDLIVAHVCLRV